MRGRKPRKKLSERGKRYRKYLLSDHWKRLRGRILKRDKQCVRCGTTSGLQVHHKAYRDPWESALDEELVTLCRVCHGAEHGINVWGEFEIVQRKIRSQFNQMERVRSLDRSVTVPLFKKLKASIVDCYDIEQFGVVLFWYAISELGWEFRRAFKMQVIFRQRALEQEDFYVRKSILKHV